MNVKFKDGGFAAELAFAINAHEIAVPVVVNHGLVGGAVLGAAQEQAAVRAEVIVHFEHDLVIAELFIGDQDAAVAWNVLAAGNSPIHDDPFAPGLMAAGGAVASLGASVPAVQGLAVEDGNKTFVRSLSHGT